MRSTNNQPRAKKPGPNNSNVFALAASQTRRQDRSYYKQLYNFNADVELAEYSLPVLSSSAGGAKMAPGVANTTKLAPIQDEDMQMDQDAEYDMDGNLIQMEGMDQMDQMDDYADEQEPVDEGGDHGLGYEDFEKVITAQENVENNQDNELCKANFIKKNTPIWHLQQKIRDGTQAIAFFAKHGTSMPIKFLNCNRATVRPSQFRPYDLEVINDEKLLNEEFFTVSNKGVVQIISNKSKLKKKTSKKPIPTEFYQLHEWMRQSTMFNVLTSMKFFKNYLVGKVFTLWQGNVRHRTFHRTRQELSRNLIQQRRDYLDAHKEISKILYDMQSKTTYQFSKYSKSFLIDDFLGEQAKNRTDCKAAYNDRVDEITKCLSDLVRKLNEEQITRQEEDLENSQKSQTNKNESMSKKTQENALRNKLQKLTKRNFRSLGTYIRLIDYMVIETQVKINQESAEKILHDMERVEKKYWIMTKIRFELDQGDQQEGSSCITFSPPKSEFLSSYEKLMKDMVATAEDVNRVTSQTEFQNHIHGLMTDTAPRFQSIVNKSFNYEAVKEKVLDTVENDFKKVEGYTKKAEKCKEIYNHQINFVFEEWIKNEQPDMASIKATFTQFSAWEDLIQRNIESKKSAGMIQLFGGTLKESLLEKLLQDKDKLRTYLYKISMESVTDIRNQIVKIQKNLQKEPEDLITFVQYVKDLREAQENSNRLNDCRKLALDQKDCLQRFRSRDNSAKVEVGQPAIIKLTAELENVQSLLTGGGAGGLGLAVEILKAEEKKTVDYEKWSENLNQQFDAQKQEIIKLQGEISSPSLMSPKTEQDAALSELAKIDKKYKAALSKIDKYRAFEEILGIDKSFKMDEQQAFVETFELRNQIWSSWAEFKKDKKRWYHEPFRNDQQDVQATVAKIEKYNQVNMKTKMQKIPKGQSDEVLDAFMIEVAEVTKIKKLIAGLGVPAMKSRHWIKVFELLKEPVPPNLESMTLQSLLDIDAAVYTEQIDEISGTAQGELQIETQLAEVKDRWDAFEFEVIPYRDFKDKFLISGVDDLIMQLEDDQMTVGTMMGSKFVAEIRDEVEEMEGKLKYIDIVLVEWLTFQRSWMYLENIFSADDIREQLKDETRLFTQVNKFWVDHMQRVNKDRIVINYYDTGVLLQKFQMNNQRLDEIKQRLEDYLTSKRDKFPRFFFLTNDELIQILSQTRNAQAVQPFLNKCFDSIKRIEFTTAKNSKEIIAMSSPEGEKVPFSQPCFAEGPVEHWLNEIQDSMFRSLYLIAKDAMDNYPEDGRQRDAWLFDYTAQCILVVDQIQWTAGVEQAIYQIMGGKNKAALKEFLEFSDEQLQAMINLVRGDLGKQERNLMGALIVLDVHAKTVVENMIKERVDDINSFPWQKQLRYYWEELKDTDGDKLTDDQTLEAFVKQTNTRFRYGYEYQGNGPRLVVTPLTDKCYMTLTGALHLNYGGNPQGPAGTGKTETTKDLGKALAICTIVFNCSDELTYKMMERYFMGLASQGAWSCFDEFNRIGIEVLSVIAQQMLTVSTAVRARATEFEFVGRTIPLKLSFGVFITMNPGYAGRQELPDNLKALFRPVSMMIPDYALIAEITLYSEGFAEGLTLSRKMARLYSLSSEQLSKQKHYDFGMRAVKTVLLMAGKLKRVQRDDPEDVILITAMRDSNVPKFLSDDLPLFFGIIQDLFPTTVVPFTDYGQLQTAIEQQLRGEKKQIVQTYIVKIIQLLETMIIRHGNMVVGSTGTGKSTVTRILAKALTKCFQDDLIHPQGWYKTVKIDMLNPKAVTKGELYGESNPYTNEWQEGIISSLVKFAVDACEGDDPVKAAIKRWVVFDGPVDAMWIENMNTVLDDNKMLCLPNGERIKMPDTCTMMFEVNDLIEASPATVSRCGMVYLEPVHLGWEPLITSWGELQAEKISEKWLPFILNVILSSLKYLLPKLRKSCKEMIPSQDCNLVQSCLNLTEIFLNKEAIPLENKDRCYNPEKPIMNYCAFALIWSLGANVHEDKRSIFQELLRETMDQVESPHKAELPEGDLYEYTIDSQYYKFQPWNDLKEDFKYDRNISFFNIMVPTSDTVKYSFLIRNLTNHGFNALITGDTGVGKSVVTRDYLMNTPETIDHAVVNFSGKTTTKNLMDAFEGKLESRRRDLLGPKPGRKMIFFVDDVNMPQLDAGKAQPPVELLRQVLDHGGFYDTKKLFFKKVADTRFIAACAPPGGGRNEVTPRLFRQYTMIWVPQLSKEAMNTIFVSILRGYVDLKEDPALSLLTEDIIVIGVDTYLKAIDTFLPTPSKCHYTFNLRDMSKVVQGMLMCPFTEIEDKDYLTKLFLNEIFRVFRDRLINNDDRKSLTKITHGFMEKQLKLGWEIESFENVIFGDYDNPKRQYLMLGETDSLIPKLEELLMVYNSDHSQMNLVFFEDCIQHLTRIARTLKQERGNALLVGLGGSGRRSMAMFGGGINEIETFGIEITKSYREKEFHEDIKNLMRICGVEGKDMQFLFSDTQIVQESFLEDINNLLNSGEIPNLFPADEKVAICEEIEAKAREDGEGNGRDAQFNWFVSQCRQHLHIVLAFSPVGDKFRDRCRQFPSIINCCTIDWYNLWPTEALYSVASRQYIQEQDSLNIKENIEQLSTITVFIHNAVQEASDKFYDQLRRKNYVTPTSYLELVKTFVKYLKHQQEVIPARMNRYEVGLRKLAETNVMVEELQKSLITLKPEIAEKEIKVQGLVEELKRESAIAIEQEKTTAKDEAECRKGQADVMKIQDECKKILDEAMPAFNAAVKSLDTLKPGDISELKMYQTPHPDIKMVFDAVCLLQGVKQDWKTAQQLMNNAAQFVQSLKSYDKDNIKEATLKKLKKFTTDERFVPELIKAKSGAAMSVCMWVKAMDVYSEVLKIVTPLKIKLADAEKQAAVATAALNKKRAELQQVRDKIENFNRNLRENQNILEALVKQKEDIEIKLVRADKLTSGLISEAARWKEAVKNLEADMVNLKGNMILAAGYQSYVGVFTYQFRQDLLANWMDKCGEQKINYDKSWTCENIQGDPVKIREWKIKGLPADNLSVENGIICQSAARWPLLIDPQSQANKWLKNQEKENNLQVTKLSNPRFLKIIEVCLPAGNPVMIENIQETLDPSLEPLLTKDIRKINGQDSIKLGDAWVAINPDFKFYVTSKLPNPHYLPEVCIKVTLINFTVTTGGLEDQLLVEIIKFEQPELEQQRDTLIVTLADFKRQLKELEDKILNLVSEADEDILGDEELINVLEQSKITSVQINERVIEAEKTALIITEQRESYRIAATRGSILYFVIADLALIDPMYQYSLEFFAGLFNKRLGDSEKSEEKEKRIQIIIDDLTSQFYINICRGLFEKDKLMYSFLNTVSILRQEQQISAIEWNFFLRGTANDYSEHQVRVDYIPEKVWQNLVALETEVHPNFKDITKSLEDPADRKTWKQIMDTENPQKVPLPPIYEERLSSFQKVCLAKVLRDSKVLLYIKIFVAQELGPQFIESPPFELKGPLMSSTPVSPIIFVLTPGSAPIQQLRVLAKQQGMQDRLKIVSLGQGQDKEAERLMDQGQKQGDWVCLENCHYYTSWMPQLEKLQEKLDANMINPDYRLWLTTFSSPDFPVPVLQTGIKITNEPPKGLKANMIGTFDNTGEDQYEACSKPREYKKLFFALAYFHACILERRKYGAIGWNERYDWMNADFECSNMTLQMLLDEQPEVPYQALNIIIAQVNYGGRVTDERDVRTIGAILKKYFTPEIMSDNYKLSKLDVYYAPPEGTFAQAKEYLSSLPLEEDPEVFGLHPNANMIYETGTMNKFLDAVISIQPRIASAGSGKTPEQEAREMAQAFLKILPKNIDKEQAHPDTFKNDESGKPLSLGTFCNQEMERFNYLLKIMRNSLIMLDKAIEGTVVMSLELELMFNSFLIGKVPASWVKWAYPSLKPLNSWISDLIERVTFMRSWVEKGPPNTFWIPGFFFPQGFKTAALQMHARANLLEINKLAFKTHVQTVMADGIKEAPETGIYIHGLFFQGARWDMKTKVVTEMEHRVPITDFPAVWLEPLLQDDIKIERTYECPLYKTSERKGELTTTGHSTNFVMYLDLPTDVAEDHWIRRGAALLAMTDD